MHMGSIKVIASLFIIIVVGGAGLFVMLFPLLFDANLKKRTGEGIVNHVLTAVELICLIGIFNPGDAEFAGNLGVLTIVAVIAAVAARNKAKKRNLDKRTTACAMIAQVLSPASILFIVIMISNTMRNAAKNRANKK